MLTTALILAILAIGTLANGNAGGENRNVVFPGIGEYLYVADLTTWRDAYAFCAGLDGTANLAVLDSDGEADVLRQLMATNNATSIHLGFHDRFLEGHFVTITDTEVDSSCSSLWAPGHPNGGDAANCGGFTADGIVDVDCQLRQAFVCEYPLPDGYETIEDAGVYKYHTEFVSWPEAWRICEAEGAHLIILNSEAELTAIRTKYPPQSWPWVGVHRSFGDKEFVTVYNEPLTSLGYNTWVLGFPYPEYEDEVFPYVCVDYYPPTFGLRTYGEEAVLQFICEKELVNHQAVGCNL